MRDKQGPDDKGPWRPQKDLYSERDGKPVESFEQRELRGYFFEPAKWRCQDGYTSLGFTQKRLAMSSSFSLLQGSCSVGSCVLWSSLSPAHISQVCPSLRGQVSHLHVTQSRCLGLYSSSAGKPIYPCLNSVCQRI